MPKQQDALERHNNLWLQLVLAGAVVAVLATVVAEVLAVDDDRNDWLVHAIAAGFLSGIMVLYARLGRRTVALDVRADGIYYMGLLYTFIALVLVLIRTGARDIDDATVVIGPFGIALVTTIVGLGGRVLISMQRESGVGDLADAVEDFSEISRSMRMALQDVRRSTSEMQSKWWGGVREMTTSAQKMEQALTTVNEAASGLKNSLGSFGQTTRSLDQSAAALRNSLSKTNDQINRMSAVLNRTVSALDKIGNSTAGAEMDRMGSTAATVITALERVRQPAVAAAQGLQTLHTGIENGSKGVSRWTSSCEAMGSAAERLVAPVSGAANKMQALADASEEVQGTLASVKTESVPLVEKIRRLDEAMQGAASALERVPQTTAAAAQGLETLHASVMNGSEATDRMASSSEALGAATERLVAPVSGAVDNIQALADVSGETKEALASVTAESSPMIEEVGRLSGAVQKATSALEQITDKINTASISLGDIPDSADKLSDLRDRYQDLVNLEQRLARTLEVTVSRVAKGIDDLSGALTATVNQGVQAVGTITKLQQRLEKLAAPIERGIGQPPRQVIHPQTGSRANVLRREGYRALRQSKNAGWWTNFWQFLKGIRRERDE